MSKLPEQKTDADAFEKFSKVSIDVLVRIEGFSGVRVGRYIHADSSWVVEGWHGSPNVVEWWDMPITGSGNAL